MLYTAERLASFGYSFYLGPFCGQGRDSAEHLFFSYPLAHSGIAWIQCLLSPSFPSAPCLSLNHVLFGFSPAELRVVPRVFCHLLNVLKCLVWSQRNDHRFRSQQPSAVTLITRLRFPLHFSFLSCLGVSALCAGAAGLPDSGGPMVLSASWRVTHSGSSCKLLPRCYLFHLLLCVMFWPPVRNDMALSCSLFVSFSVYRVKCFGPQHWEDIIFAPSCCSSCPVVFLRSFHFGPRFGSIWFSRRHVLCSCE